MRIILVAYIFPSRLEVSVSAQAGFATVGGLGRCPGRLCHGVSGLGRCQAGFATVLAAWVGAQAGLATVLAAWVGAQ